MAPPNGQTVHAAIKISDSIQSCFYVARLNPNASPRQAAPAGGGRGRGNPAVAESLVQAALPGRPLAR